MQPVVTDGVACSICLCLSVGMSVMIVTFVSTAKVAVPIKMPFRMLCRVGPGKHVRWGAHCRHRANRIEPSVCGGNAALSQITFTSC